WRCSARSCPSASAARRRGQRCAAGPLAFSLPNDDCESDRGGRVEVEKFSDIEAEFIERVHSTVWCNFATVDRKGRPYSRILHPLWGGSTGWILTHRSSHKSKQLAANPHASLAYIRGDLQKPVDVDCVAEWEDGRAERRRIWDLVAATPPPL